VETVDQVWVEREAEKELSVGTVTRDLLLVASRKARISSDGTSVDVVRY
jgi:hypothetical protein